MSFTIALIMLVVFVVAAFAFFGWVIKKALKAPKQFMKDASNRNHNHHRNSNAH